VSKHINPIKKALVKKALLEGKSMRQAAKAAGYSDSTSEVACNLTSVKQSIEEIKKAFGRIDLTEDMIVSGLLKIALSGEKESNKVAAWRTLAEVKAMLTQKQIVTGSYEVKQAQDHPILSRYMAIPIKNTKEADIKTDIPTG
jgi:trans-2-enoyl-CoA reductase